MTQEVSRMYATPEQATKAVADLKDASYEHVFMFAGGDKDSLVDAMMKANIWKPHAEVYADKVSKGAALVTTHAHFGTAVEAMDIMAQHDPVDAGIEEYKEPMAGWDDAAPFSCALNLPTLLPTKSPYEPMGNIPALTKGRKFFSGTPLLAKPTTTFDMRAVSALSGKPAICSGMIGLPVLKR